MRFEHKEYCDNDSKLTKLAKCQSSANSVCDDSGGTQGWEINMRALKLSHLFPTMALTLFVFVFILCPVDAAGKFS